LRILDRRGLIVRERGEAFNPDINSPALFRRGRDFLLRLFNREDHIPAIGFTLDRAGLDLPLDRAREMDFDFADLRQTQFPALERKTALWICEGIISGAGTKPGKPSPSALSDSSKEAVEGRLDALQGVLNDLGMNPGKFRAILFDLGQLIRLSRVVD